MNYEKDSDMYRKTRGRLGLSCRKASSCCQPHTIHDCKGTTIFRNYKDFWNITCPFKIFFILLQRERRETISDRVSFQPLAQRVSGRSRFWLFL